MLTVQNIQADTWIVTETETINVEHEVTPAIVNAAGEVTSPAVMGTKDVERVLWSRRVATKPGGTSDDAIALAQEAANPIPPTEAKLRRTRFNDLAELRWQRETGGLDLSGGARIITTRESQSQIAGVVQSINAALITGPIDWKLASGWQQLSDAEILAIGGAVADHVKRCFAAERAVFEQMEATTGDLAGFDIEAAFDAAYRA